jgi:molybdate transport system regulatory protein
MVCRREEPLPKYPLVQLRIILKPKTLLGPGKADLLEGIQETGSIAAAGRRMSMSYKRAWYLIDTMNSYFKEPLVVSTKGGKAGGGAQLTATGLEVLELQADQLAIELKAEKAPSNPRNAVDNDRLVLRIPWKKTPMRRRREIIVPVF